MDLVMQQVGKRMEEARRRAGLGARDMARIVGRTPQAVRGYERGVNQPPGEILRMWAAATSREIAWFFQSDTLDSTADTVSRMSGHITHPGVEALAEDVDLRVEAGVTGEMIEMLRSFRGQVLGDEIVIRTRAEALSWMEKLRAHRAQTGHFDHQPTKEA